MANTDKQVVFIDANVPDLRDLLSGLAPGVRAFVLDPHRNGLAQIARILATHELTDLSSISIVGHGSSGVIEVGGTTLDNDGLSSHAAALNKIGAALAPDGALQLYSCDVASGIAGQQFMADLSQYAGGVTVDASDRDIGLTAAGENWTLDATAGATGSAPVAPFTAQAESGFQGTLTLTANQIVFDATNEESGSIDDGTRVEQFGVSGSTEISGSSVDIADASKTGDSGLVFENSGIAVDSALNEYFVAVDNPDTHILSIQKGALSGGSLNTFWTNPLPDINTTNFPPVVAVVGGLALDAGTGELYFAQAGISYSTGDPVAADTGIYKVSINGGTPTLVNSTSNTLFEPTYLALDVSANLLFFTDAFDSAVSEGLFPSVNNLDVMNLSTGSITVLHSFTQQNNDDPNFLLQGLAVDSVNDVVYLATANLADNTSADNAILSIPFSVSGSGSSASTSIGTISTLYSGAGADQPSDIVIDPAHDIFYTTGEEPTTGGFYGAVFEGSLSGGSSLTKVLSMDSVLPRGNGAAVNPAALDDQLPQLVLLTQPTVTASGTVTADSGGSAVTVDSGVTVSDQDGQNLAEATVTGALTGDTLSFNGGATKTFPDGATISSSFSGGTLTLSGDASPADYQTALDAVTFGTTSTSATPRTIDWTVSDGVVTSPTTTSTVDVQVPPVVTAGGTVTFDGGGSPVVLDSGLVVTDASSSTLSSATVRITGYISGDTLTVGTPGGLGTSFSNGALTLTGTASLATYQTALESITYSVSPSNSDPTGGGSDTTRTIDWTVNDGVLNSGTATSTLDTVHVKPTIVAGATATFDGGGSAVTLDSGVTESDVDSGGVLASATISIGTGYISGDTLNFTNTNSTTEGNISVASDSSGVLKLTSSGETATLAQWQTALESVTYTFSPSNGDPTGGGSDTSRTIDWVVNDGSSSNGISSTATSTLDTVHVAPTIAASGNVDFGFGGSPVILDSTADVSDVDSGGNLSSAAVSIGAGYISSEDTLSFTSEDGITGAFSSGVLRLSGTASLTDYDAVLQSVTFDTTSTTTGSRTIDWSVNDGVLGSAIATSTVDVAPCYCPGTLIKTKRGQKRVENLKIGDKVMTASGEQRPIKWVGRRSYSGRFVMGRKDILPVRIKAGALDDNVPKRDLWISPNHAMFLDGVLIEAKDLINRVSIVQAESVEQVEYFHIELESHDVIIAEGALSESFIDDDSRGMFHNGREYRTLYPDAAIGLAQYCAPRVEDGYEVEAVRQRIAARAGLAANSEGTRIGDLRGYVDRITSECIAGWAQSVEHPEAPVCLDIFAGGLLVGQVLANRYREDLERAGMGSGCHSFEFTLPSEIAFAPDEVEVRRSLDGVALELTIEASCMLRQNASRDTARRAVA